MEETVQPGSDTAIFESTLETSVSPSADHGPPATEALTVSCM